MGESAERGPQPLAEGHDLAAFDSGVPELDRWLKVRAHANEASGASRTFVLAKETRVVGYYSLTVGGVTHQVAPGRGRRTMPDPVPVAILARLAVDREWQGRRLGGYLLQDAVLRTIAAGANLGIRGMLIHAIADEARNFYQHYGFMPSPIEPFTLIANMVDLLKKIFPGRSA